MPNRNTRDLRNAVWALAVLSIIWGYNWVVMKKVMRYADPFDFSSLRTLFGAITLFAVLLALRRPLRPVALGPTLLLGLLQTAAFTGLVQWALVSAAAGKTAVLVYVMPFWLLPLAWITLGERIAGVQWLAVAAAGAGLVAILEPWRGQGSLFGSTLAVLASLAWAASSIVVKRLRGQQQVDLLSLTAWQMLVGSAVLVVIALLHPSRPIEVNAYFIGALAYNAVLCTGLAWLLWLFVLDRLPAGIAGLASLAVPAVGVLSAWIELGERPSAGETIGMALIAAALLVLSLVTIARQRRPDRPVVPE